MLHSIAVVPLLPHFHARPAGTAGPAREQPPKQIPDPKTCRGTEETVKVPFFKEKARFRILRWQEDHKSQNTQIASHKACGLGKQKSEACFAFWTLPDHRKGHPTLAFHIFEEQKA